jgi:hypothetical protein
MKFIVSVFLTALLAFAVGLQLPWWCIAAASFLVAVLIPQQPGRSWLSGFTAVFLLWCVLAMIAEQKGADLVAREIAGLLPLKGNTFLLVLVTGFIGGLVAGFGSLTGCLGRKLLREK